MDSLAHRRGFVQSLDPRAKMAVTGGAVLLAALSEQFWRLGVLAICLLALARVAGLPLGYLARRLLLVLPFAGTIALLLPFTSPGEPIWSTHLGPWEWTLTAQGLSSALLLLARALTASMAVFILVATTPFDRLLHAMHRLGTPRIIVLVLAFLYRYLFVLVDEAMRMYRAAQARNLGRRRRGRVAVAAALLGSLFLRTYERAERVYMAMTARGFQGRIELLEPLHFHLGDAAFTALGMAFLLALGMSP